ncbi:hypothetical protein AGLY_013325 [Aphis glycines]|uniref:Uncharacterized protein n=1 Tax=Aphis glycines TaxID=307491 RepID=A0A6G0T658_APHGL|nr:hypothetical protein AGLY_013325 [Aphis glycines]
MFALGFGPIPGVMIGEVFSPELIGFHLSRELRVKTFEELQVAIRYCTFWHVGAVCSYAGMMWIDLILNGMMSCGVDCNYLYGQGCDGTSNMAGHVKPCLSQRFKSLFSSNAVLAEDEETSFKILVEFYCPDVENIDVIFILESSLLVQRAGRRERYQILLEASQGYELADIEALKRRFDAIFPPLGVLDSPKSMEVAVADANRTIDERLDTLENAVKSLSAEFATFTFNYVVTNQAPTVQAPTNRAPTVQAPTIYTSAQTRTVTKSWCYCHIRFGKDSRKCSSDLCTFSPKISTKNITSKNVIILSPFTPY